MSESLNIFDKEHASREKYIYFVCGLAGALFAYIGKDYFPVHPIDCIGILTISALISFIVCIAFGMARIQVYTHGMSINRDVIVEETNLRNLRVCRLKFLSKEITLSEDNKTGKTYSTIEEYDADIKAKQTIRDKTHIRMEKWFKWATWLLIISNGFLALGFILLISAKLAA
jgi:hypothetical protein